MNLREQVQKAMSNYVGLPQIPFSEDMPDEEAYLATPNRLAYALGWIVANAIVGQRYGDSAIDAIPIYHPENGWDRFLLTRRMTSERFRSETANSFGMIMLDGEDPPRITKPSGTTRLALGTLLRDDPDTAQAEIQKLFPPGPAIPADLGMRWRERQRHYPKLYHAVTDIILEYPGIVAAREIFVDNQPIDGAYHPLYLHGAALEPAMVYDWFLVQFGERAAFFRTHAGHSIYETDRRGWSTVKRQLQEESIEGVKTRILSWLRIEGQPDKAID